MTVVGGGVRVDITMRKQPLSSSLAWLLAAALLIPSFRASAQRVVQVPGSSGGNVSPGSSVTAPAASVAVASDTDRTAQRIRTDADFRKKVVDRIIVFLIEREFSDPAAVQAHEQARQGQTPSY